MGEVDGEAGRRCNRVCMLMPGWNKTLLKSSVGSLESLPDLQTLRRGAAEVELDNLFEGSASTTYKFDTANSYFASPTERLMNGKLVKGVGGSGQDEDDAFVAVLLRKP